MIIKKSSEVKLGSNFSKKESIRAYLVQLYTIYICSDSEATFFVFLDFGLGWAERTFHRIRENNNGSIVISWFIRRIDSEVAK